MISSNKINILKSIPGINIPRKAVLRRMGYPGDIKTLSKQIDAIFRDLLNKAGNYIKPAGSYIILKIHQQKNQKINFENTKFTLECHQVTRMLAKSEYVVIFTVTIGPELEETVKVLLDNNQITKAYILDAIGSETVDAVADRLQHKLIKSEAEAEGYTITPRFSPGYGDWDITIQSKITELCQSQSIGVTVNEFFMMIPKKSVSAVFGLEK